MDWAIFVFVSKSHEYYHKLQKRFREMEKRMADVVDLLYASGHEKILVVSGKKNTRVTMDRIMGVYRAMSRKGYALKEDDILYCEFDEQKAYEKTLDYLKTYGKTKHETVF